MAVVLLLGACASVVAPPAEPIDQRALKAIAEGAKVKREIDLTAGKAHGEKIITQAQLDSVAAAAEDLEARLNATRAQLRSYLSSSSPDAGALEESLVRLGLARAHVVTIADALALQWRR